MMLRIAVLFFVMLALCHLAHAKGASGHSSHASHGKTVHKIVVPKSKTPKLPKYKVVKAN